MRTNNIRVCVSARDARVWVFIYLCVCVCACVRAAWCGTAPDYPLKGSWKMYFPRAYSEKLHPAASAHDHSAPYPPAGDAARYVIWLMDIVWVFPRSPHLDGTDCTRTCTHAHIAHTNECITIYMQYSLCVYIYMNVFRYIIMYCVCPTKCTVHNNIIRLVLQLIAAQKVVHRKYNTMHVLVHRNVIFYLRTLVRRQTSSWTYMFLSRAGERFRFL